MEIETWNKRITRLVQQFFPEQMWFTQNLVRLRPKDDWGVRSLGIGDAIEAYSVAITTTALVGPDESANVRLKDCELQWHQMPQASKSGECQHWRERMVIIDPKSDDRSPTTERRLTAKQRFDQLVTVL